MPLIGVICVALQGIVSYGARPSLLRHGIGSHVGIIVFLAAQRAKALRGAASEGVLDILMPRYFRVFMVTVLLFDCPRLGKEMDSLLAKPFRLQAAYVFVFKISQRVG